MPTRICGHSGGQTPRPASQPAAASATKHKNRWPLPKSVREGEQSGPSTVRSRPDGIRSVLWGRLQDSDRGLAEGESGRPVHPVAAGAVLREGRRRGPGETVLRQGDGQQRARSDQCVCEAGREKEIGGRVKEGAEGRPLIRVPGRRSAPRMPGCESLCRLWPNPACPKMRSGVRAGRRAVAKHSFTSGNLNWTSDSMNTSGDVSSEPDREPGGVPIRAMNFPWCESNQPSVRGKLGPVSSPPSYSVANKKLAVSPILEQGLLPRFDSK